MAERRLLRFLEENGVTYELIKHSPTFTAQETADAANISGKLFAKSVLLKADGKLIMVVEPGHMTLDLEWIKNQLDCKDVQLATEEEFQAKFPNCEVGAIPPFGNLYDLPVYLIDKIPHDCDIAFDAGTHSEIIKVQFKDWLRLVQPEILH